MKLKLAFSLPNLKFNFSAKLVFPVYEGYDFALKIVFVFNLGNVITSFQFSF